MIKFIHLNYEKYVKNKRKKYKSKTIAVELINQFQVMNKVHNFLEDSNNIIDLNIGISLVNDCDRYVKKIGRDISTSKMKWVTFNIKYIKLEKDFIYIHLNVYENINLRIKYNKNSKKVNITSNPLYGFFDD